MKKIVYANKIPEQFKDDSNYIKEMLEYFYNELELNCKIIVKFIENASMNIFEFTDCMVRNLSAKKHELIITNFLLKTISRDGGNFFCVAIYHEFKHIKDYVNFAKTKLFNFKLSLIHQKNFERQYIFYGYTFWTEIYAYFHTLKFAKDNDIKYEKITFGSLVSDYKKTIALNKKYYYKKDLTHEEADRYVETVDSFLYLCSKYMASFYANHSRVPHAKIEKNAEYKKVYSILVAIEPKITKLKNCRYGAKSDLYLFKLGKVICEKIRWKIFKVGLTKRKGKVYSFY